MLLSPVLSFQQSLLVEHSQQEPLRIPHCPHPRLLNQTYRIHQIKNHSWPERVDQDKKVFPLQEQAISQSNLQAWNNQRRKTTPYFPQNTPPQFRMRSCCTTNYRNLTTKSLNRQSNNNPFEDEMVERFARTETQE